MPQHHLVIPDTVQARFLFNVNGSTQSIVTHFLVPANYSATPTSASALFDSLKALWAANLASHCPTTTIWASVVLRDLRQQAMPEISSTTPPQAGTGTAVDALPRSIAAVLTVRTNSAGRKFRGRMYWGGFSEEANDATGLISAAVKTALDTFASGFLSAANIGGVTFGVAHRPTAFDDITGLPISPGLGFTTPATQILCRDRIWDSQRRRNQ